MEPIGTIVAVNGPATAQSGTAVRALETGGPVYQGETLHTGPQANVEIKFADDSVMSQGPDSTMTLDEFVYDAAEPSASSMLSRLSTGTFRLITGKIADSNPDGVALETPLASIGIRGTGVDIGVGPDGNERIGLFNYDNLDVVVSNGQGTRFITQAGVMLDIAPSGALGTPRPYTPQEIQMFQQAAPISSVPGLQELSPDGEDGQGDEGDGEGEGEEAQGEGDAEGEDDDEGDDAEDDGEGEEEGDGEAGEDGEEEPEGEPDGQDADGLDDLGDGLGDIPGTGFGDTGDAFGSTDPFAGAAGTDTVDGTTGTDTQTSGNDTVAGTTGEDTAAGDDDDDDDDQPASGDTITVGGSSYVLQLGTDDADTLTGGSDDDMMYGRNGSDRLSGGAGDDFFVGDYHQHAEDAPDDAPNITADSGSAGNDTMIGGAGYDEFLSGEGYDKFVGYSTTTDVDVVLDHNDTSEDKAWEAVIFNRKLSEGWDNTGNWGHTGVLVTLADEVAVGSAVDEWGNNDTIIGIDNIDGSLQDDSITGNADSNDIWGDDGNDTILGLDGDDWLGGADGDDSIVGGTGADHLSGDDDDSGAIPGNDTIQGGIGNDTIDGGGDSDSLLGGDDNDQINGGDGNDSLYGDAGADSLWGGAGDDELEGGDDNDTLSGDSGNDMFWGGAGADNINGDADDDLIEGGAGADSMYGGDGKDTLSYDGAGASVVIDITNNSGSAGDASGDEFHDFEVYFGSQYDDTLSGSGGSGDYVLDGNLGADSLVGGSGQNLLDGGSGTDTLDAGSDTVVDYFYWDDPGHGNIAETVLNFDSTEDKLAFNSTNFSSISFTSGNYAADYGAGTTNVDYFVFDTSNNILYYDDNGSAAGGTISQIANFASSDAPLAGNFVLVTDADDAATYVL